MKNHLRIPTAAVLLGCSFVLYASHSKNQRTNVVEPIVVKFVGASVAPRGQLAIKLAWSIEQGWFPQGGFQLVRVVQGAPTHLNTPPLKPIGAVASSEAILTAGRGLNNPIPPTPPLPRESSISVFQSAENAARNVVATKKGTNSLAISKAIAANVKVTNFFTRLKGGQDKRRAVISPSDTKAVADAETQMARDKLMFAAAFDETIAQNLGLRFTDTQVVQGQTYKYELHAGVNGTDVLVASTTVVAGQDSNTVKPLVPIPMQVGQHHVQLHFEIPPIANEAAFGSFTFNVYRGSSASGTPLNTIPILPTYVETDDSKLISSMVAFEDKEAPIGTVSYAVVTKDIFGRISAPTVVNATVLDLAGPGDTGPVVTILNHQAQKQPASLGKFNVTHRSPVPSSSSVRVIWAPPTTISDGTPLTNGAFTYRVQRTDTEAGPFSAQTTLAGPISGQPVDLSTIDVRTLFKLRHDIEVIWGQYFAILSGKDNFDKKAYSGDTFLSQKASTFVSIYLLQYVGKIPPAVFCEYTDSTPPADHILRYQVTPILVRDQREAAPTLSETVGVPATVVPGASAVTHVQDDPAPQTSSELQALSSGSMTNAARMQLTPGMRGPQGLIKENLAADPKQLGSLMLKSAQMSGQPGHGRGSAPAAVQAGQGKGTGSVVQQTAPLPAVIIKGGVPTSYGRKVTLTWTQPSYASKLQYRVFRANGTGFHLTAGSNDTSSSEYATMINPSGHLVQNASTQVGTSRAVSGRAKPAQGRIIPGLRRVKPGSVPTASTMGGTAMQFVIDGTPPDADFIDIGLTKTDATSFVDLIPTSQSSTFYYFVLPINRWGTTGIPSTKAKIKVKPSLSPTTPSLKGAFAQADGSIQIRIVPNLEIEDIASYHILRMEIPVPPSVTQIPPTSGPVGPHYATVGAPKTAIKTYSKLVDGQSLASVGGGSGATRFGIESHSSPMSILSLQQGNYGATLAPLTPLMASVLATSSYSLIQTPAPVLDDDGMLNFTDSTVTPGKYYAYRVIAINTATLYSAASQFLDAGALKVKADPPTITALYDATNQWTVVTITPPSSGANAYVIERVNTAGTNWVNLGVIPVGNQFKDGAALSGRTYRYRVSTVDSVGNVSVPSAEVTVIVP